MLNGKRVAIIIVTYNGSEYIGDCLSSVKSINYDKIFFKVFLIDNASTDKTVDIEKKLGGDFLAAGINCEIILNKENLGFVGGNNLGMRRAIDENFDYAYLLNQDTVVDKDFLTEAVKIAEDNHKIAAVQSKLLLYNEKNLINSWGNEIHFLGFAYAGGHRQLDREMKPRPITYASGAALLLKTAILNKIGLFNEDFFMYHEDVDLGWRARLAGSEIFLAPDSVVYHKYEFNRSIKKYYWMERNRFLVIFHNYKIATILLILPAAIIMELMLFFYSFLTGWFKEKLRAYLYFFNPNNWKKIFKMRKSINQIRVVSDREILSHFVGKIKFQEINNPLIIYFFNPVFNLIFLLIKNIIWW